MLKRLIIKRFKSIYNASLEFGRANLFVGVNGSGKSNVLEALGVLSSAMSRGLEPSVLDSRGVRLSLPHLFKSAFKNTRLSPHFRLEAHFEHGRYECSIRSGRLRTFLEFHSEFLYDGDTKVFGRGPNGFRVNRNVVEASASVSRIDSSRSLWDVISPFATISDGLRADLDEFARFAIYAPQTAIMRGLAIDPRLIEPLGLTGSGLASAFGDALNSRASLTPEQDRAFQRILDLIWTPGWANRITVRGFDPNIVPPQVKSEGKLLYIRDRFMTTTRNFLSGYDASEGTLYLIFVATLLLHPLSPKTFALDNVDGTLNSDLVRKLTKALVDAGIRRGDQLPRGVYQTFMTSHHPASLDSFDIFEDSQKIFVARRADKGVPDGRTFFEPVLPPPGTTKSEWIERKHGKNLSELLLENMIPGALR